MSSCSVRSSVRILFTSTGVAPFAGWNHTDRTAYTEDRSSARVRSVWRLGHGRWLHTFRGRYLLYSRQAGKCHILCSRFPRGFSKSA